MQMDRFSALAGAALSALLIVAQPNDANAQVPGVAPDQRNFTYVEIDTDGIEGNEQRFTPEFIQQIAEQQILDIEAAQNRGDEQEAARLRAINLIPISLPFGTSTITQEEFFEASSDMFDEGYPVQRYGIVVDKGFRRFSPEAVNNASEEELQNYLTQQDRIIARLRNALNVMINKGTDVNGDGKIDIPPLALEYGFGGNTQIYAIEYDPRVTRTANDGTQVPVEVGEVIPIINDHSVGYDYNTEHYWNITSAEGLKMFAYQMNFYAERGLHTMTQEQYTQASQNLANNDQQPTNFGSLEN